jgi:hypothetical protein
MPVVKATTTATTACYDLPPNTCISAQNPLHILNNRKVTVASAFF